MKARVLGRLAPAIILWLALNWLGLVFVPMVASPNRSVSLIEPSLPILIIEIVVCLAAIGYGVSLMVKHPEKGKNEN